MTYLLVVFFFVNGEWVNDDRFQPVPVESKSTCLEGIDAAESLFSGSPPYVLGCVEVLEK